MECIIDSTGPCLVTHDHAQQQTCDMTDRELDGCQLDGLGCSGLPQYCHTACNCPLQSWEILALFEKLLSYFWQLSGV